jgi:TonB family protein
MPAPPPPPPPPPPPASKSIGTSTKETPPPASGVPPSAGNGMQEEDIFVVIEELPQFPGGAKAMNAWITKNKRDLGPGINEKIDGEVYVTFIVTRKGKISTPVIKKSLHPLLDMEAMRLVSGMPDWTPGLQDGKPVDVQVMVPVAFKLP